MAKEVEKLSVVPQEPVTLDDGKSETSDVKKETESVKDTKEVAKTEQPPAVPEKESSKVNASGKNEQDEEDAPAKPARPVSPVTQRTKELKEAFPSIEDKIITAVLIASSGQLDPAFNALLYLSDPSFKPEIPISAAPSSSGAGPVPVATLTDDEKLARRLQQEYEREEHERRLRHDRRRKGQQQQQQQRRQQNPNDYDSPDEFEQIKESFTQGFEEARTTLNGWVSGLTKKFQDPEEQEQERRQQNRQQQPHQQYQQQQQQQRPSTNPKLFGALGGSSYNKKQSLKFDEDPIILSNDFHDRINLHDNDNDDDDAPVLPRRLNQTGTEQSDSFTEPNNKKWQPLNSDAPVNSDAFLVTDSEDEEVAPTTKKTEK